MSFEDVQALQEWILEGRVLRPGQKCRAAARRRPLFDIEVF